jgi:hypothetical protein
MDILESLFLNNSPNNYSDNLNNLNGGGKNINLTNKTNKNVRIISDYEGQQLPEAQNNEHYIICGDIIDSTVGGGGTSDIPKYIFGGHEKHFNIRNMMKIVNEPEKYTLIYGNRDVNKFKTGSLTLLEAKSPDFQKLVDNFNNAEILMTQYNTYKDSSKFKWKSSTKNWLTYWNNAPNINITDKLFELKNEFGKDAVHWDAEDYEFDNTPFLTRFNKIFGVDGREGTMSAGNLLYTIPKELAELNYYSDEIKKKLLNTEDKDFLAFVTLSVFRTMCIEPKSIIEKIKKQFDKSEKKQEIVLDKFLRDTNLRGLLHKFYNSPNAIFVGYMNFKDKLILFSHGGITSDALCNFQDQMLVLQKHIEENKERLTQTLPIKEIQKGGSKKYLSESIIKVLESIESKYNNLLTKIMSQINTIKVPTLEMLFFMSLSAPYKPPSFQNEFINLSPINPGIETILANKFYCYDKKLIQVFGHVPRGFGTGLYKFVDNNCELNIINLDISQSFKYSGIAGKTNNELLINNKGIININTIIDVSNEKIQNKEFTEKISTKNTNNGEISINGELESLLNNFKEQKDEGYTYVYHGISGNNLVYSKLKGIDKQLFLVEMKQAGGYKEKYLKYKQKYLELKNTL